MTTLVDTDASAIGAELVRERGRAGSPAMGMVLTLVVVMSEEDKDEALAAAKAASREHPARVLALVLGSARGKGSITADVQVGSRGWTGETAVMWLSGEVVKHAESVVLPLLLPDSPVVVWWASEAPDDPAADPVGRLGQRRITDAAAVSRGRTQALLRQCESYHPGSTDLAWTRVTPWRALLAAAVDQEPSRVTAARVVAERTSPSADLLGAWLGQRLKVDVERGVSDGPGITEVALATKRGPVTIRRSDGKLGTLSSPDQPDRRVALNRRGLPELLAEELRHLDEDDVYAGVVRHLARDRGTGGRTRKARS
jgi:glucose-6-phosphate dehydrogenase assembly protein OpcA